LHKVIVPYVLGRYSVPFVSKIEFQLRHLGLNAKAGTSPLPSFIPPATTTGDIALSFISFFRLFTI
jgi:hypothetical protein